MRFATLLMVPIVAFVMAVVPARAATKLSVDTSQGYARILFVFDVPNPVEAVIADGVLTIAFARAAEPAAEEIARRLDGVVTSARKDADGRTYRFALGGPFRLHRSVSGPNVAIDLVPMAFAGKPPELPPYVPPKKERPAAPKDPSKLPPLAVRVGEHADFTRVVFDWADNVPYTVYPGHGHVTLRFDAAARPDFSMLSRRRPPWIKSAGWRIEDGKLVVELATDPESPYSDFREGTKIAIDVKAPATDAAVVAPPRGTDAERAAPEIIVPSGSDAATIMAAAESKASEPDKPDTGKSDAGRENNAEAAVAPPEGEARPYAERTANGAVLSFPAAKGHAAAVFLRGSRLWIVLDGHGPVDIAALAENLAPIASAAEAPEAEGAAVVLLALKEPLLVSAREEGAALRVVLSPTVGAPPAPTLFSRGKDARLEPRLIADLVGATRAITLIDPDAGDPVIVLPAPPGRAVLTPKRFVELQALATAQGLAVIPYAEDIAISVEEARVMFGRPDGLSLSPSEGAIASAGGKGETGTDGPAFVDFAEWSATGGARVADMAHSWRERIAHLAESDANPTRIQLARFYLANDLASEALGLIALAQTSNRTLAGDPALATMKGVASYMMARYRDARGYLALSLLDGDPHAAFWRGLTSAALKDWAAARRELEAADRILHRYPDEWRARAQLASAESALAVNDVAGAGDALHQLPKRLPRALALEADFERARLLAAQGRTKEAATRFRAIENADYPPMTARARLARIEIQTAAGTMRRDEAIEALEKLRFRWRGDDIELETLRKLGALYIAENRWREGLEALRVGAVNFPRAELGRLAQDDMRRAFEDLFLRGKADGLPPVEALALFYDFIDLTPIGRNGDDMIRRLSDRLVAVDLLGPAAELLRHQVDKRLEGVARASVAARLAMIQLMDRKPKEALQSLRETRLTHLPDDINAQRRILEARALSGLKQFDAALELVADDNTDEARRLRADIYWESDNWGQAAEKTEDILADRWRDARPLDDEERAQVMRAAIAYSLADDAGGLERLKVKFWPKMSAGPDGKSFEIVTEHIDRQGVAFRDLAKKVATVDTLQAFMTDFRRRYDTPQEPMTVPN